LEDVPRSIIHVLDIYEDTDSLMRGQFVAIHGNKEAFLLAVVAIFLEALKCLKAALHLLLVSLAFLFNLEFELFQLILEVAQFVAIAFAVSRRSEFHKSSLWKCTGIPSR
jgi:hypothetical protein